MDNLTSKVALVTGGSRGLGREIALGLANEGCDVAVHFNADKQSADAVVDEIKAKGRRAVAIGADLSDPARAAELVRMVGASLGSIDVLVNNAGINPSRTIDQVSGQDWERSLQVNLSPAFHTTQTALPEMRRRKWGRLIFISSIAAQTGGIIGPHYAASKAGLIGLAHYYANALAKEGITANVLAPALIETDMITNNPAIKPTLIPVGRFGQPDEVASVAVNLARNGYITGQTININGGWYMSS
ncbi:MULTISPECIES: SDR family NAD(P)-dependent oxidoreductase [Mesorhizobium]|uniref:3-oxoacyl-[acyl-carrier protein] reductase n=1 Tax=Rhizobium loti TaxID=381 RepID=A0A8E2WG22_RHILI|nr:MULTISPECIES: SDR family NAD(P)-dependent oxidoreductase [Mesorhizobium]PWJ93779.1 3-oxoacyl-[acyl-carrier protein] reductase [Mesorhizobium loti]QKC82153.1 SDR family NAD(P)-dependent oxidoreductase [Mesorhizobium sp. NZP2077]QKD15624.1 SDR family NAD(P)-dependent oxidoreductase [Mesorhizobium sp. NZP2077]